MKLADLPLEDLAHGVFPDGANETWNDHGTMIPKGSLNSETSVAHSIRAFVTSHSVFEVQLVIDGKSSRIHAWCLETPSASMKQWLEGSRSSMSLSAMWTGLAPREPFRLDLPRWLRPETMYDAVLLENDLFTHVVLGVMATESINVFLRSPGDLRHHGHRLVVIGFARSPKQMK